MPAFESNLGNGYSLILNVWERANSIDIANNTSVVDWSLHLKSRHARFEGLRLNGNLYIGGHHVWSVSNQPYTLWFNSLLLLSNSGIVIQHDADGRKLVSSSAGISSTMQGQRWTVPGLSVQGDIGLSRIPRGPRVLHQGVYKQTVPYVKHEGQWRTAVPYVKQNGVWKHAGN